MKMTKRIAAMAACAVMAATSMVSVCASATDVTTNDNYIVSEFEQDGSGIARIAAGSKTLSVTVNKQETASWCWAACTQALLDYNNKSVTQTDIVNYVKSDDIDEGKDPNKLSGNVSEMADALNHFLDVTNYSGYTGSAKTYTKIVAKIKLGKPVILAGTYKEGNTTSSHAVVCYGYNSTDSKELKLYIKSPTTTGADNITLTCSSDDATSYDMYRDGAKIGTYTVTGYAAN